MAHNPAVGIENAAHLFLVNFHAKSWVRVKLIIMIFGSPGTIAQHIMAANYWNTDYNEVLICVVLCWASLARYEWTKL